MGISMRSLFCIEGKSIEEISLLRKSYVTVFMSSMNARSVQNLDLGMPPFQKSAVFLNIVQKAFGPPPFYLNICPILQGVFLMSFETDMKYK